MTKNNSNNSSSGPVGQRLWVTPPPEHSSPWQHDLGLRTVENLVSAEIEGYKLEKSLLIYSSFDEIKNTGVYNNPLLWWKSKKLLIQTCTPYPRSTRYFCFF